METLAKRIPAWTERLNHGAKTNHMFKAPKAMLGKISLQTPEPVLLDNLQTFRLLSRLPVYGVIGMSVISRRCVPGSGSIRPG